MKTLGPAPKTQQKSRCEERFSSFTDGPQNLSNKYLCLFVFPGWMQSLFATSWEALRFTCFWGNSTAVFDLTREITSANSELELSITCEKKTSRFINNKLWTVALFVLKKKFLCHFTFLCRFTFECNLMFFRYCLMFLSYPMSLYYVLVLSCVLVLLCCHMFLCSCDVSCSCAVLCFCGE